MNNYSNGWGHLVVTLAVLAMSTFLIYTGKLDNAAVTGLLGAVISFWFMSGSVNRFSAVQAQVTASQQQAQPTGESTGAK
jgi:hypothetical protein